MKSPGEGFGDSPDAGGLATVCILAGGLGTRLGSIVADTPKPLVEVGDQPFLLHQLQLLASHGARRVVLCVGYLGEKIENTIGRSRYGIEIAYSYDVGAEGTLGALRRASRLAGDRFLFLYGDTYLRLDYRVLDSAWRRSGLPAAMAVLHNADRWQPSNAVFHDGKVSQYDKHHRTPEMAWIDYGVGGLTSGVLDFVGEEHTDLADLLHALAVSGLLYGFEATDRFYDIGTPEALAETDGFLRSHPTGHEWDGPSPGRMPGDG